MSHTHSSLYIYISAPFLLLQRSLRYVEGLLKKREILICGWKVVSINEWGAHQMRILVLSSHAIFRHSNPPPPTLPCAPVHL